MMFTTPEFWVLIAFILLVAAVGKRAFMILTRSLDEHSQKVADQLADAQRLHDEALSLLKTYKEKHLEATEQAAKIISFAEKEALEFKKSSQKEFEKFLAQKEKAIAERIAIETEETTSLLRKQTAEEALHIVERFLEEEKKETKLLTKTALKKIESLTLNPQPSKKRSKNS